MKNYGLLPTKKDRRDYSYHKTFGAVPLSSLPDEYLLLSTILDQDGLFECTSYSASAAKESEFGQAFDPQWFFDKEGVVAGAINSQGYDLRIEAATGVKFGAKPVAGQDDNSALPFKNLGYFWVHGPYDIFDSIQAAIWKEKDKKRAVIAGLMWYNDWTDAGGMINGAGKLPNGLHAVKIAGWKEVGGVPCLVIQNSFGKNHGDNGLFYMSREAANSLLTEGNFIWCDVPSDVQVRLVSRLQELLKQLSALFAKIPAFLGLTNDPAVYPPQFPPAPIPEPTHISLIPNLVSGICEAEGGTSAFGYRLNNPADLRFTAYTASLGATGAQNGFAVFPSMSAGIAAAEQLCRDAATDKLKAYQSTMTIKEFCRVFGEPPEGGGYLQIVLKHLPDCSASTQIKELL